MRQTSDVHTEGRRFTRRGAVRVESPPVPAAAPLKVLMLLENNPYPHDIRVRREAEALTAAGHHVTVVAPRRGRQPRRERIDGVDVRRFRLPEGSGAVGLLGEYALAHTALLAAAVRGLVAGADVVHMHNPPDTLFPAAMLARAMGRKSVYDHHDLAPELFAEKFGGALVEKVLRGAQRTAARVADATLVTNESQRQAVLRECPEAIDRISVVRNGPPAASMASGPVVRPGALREPKLVFVGTLETQDGVLDLPDLLAAIDRRLGPGGSAHLTIVGDGTVRHELERLLAPRGDRVRFVGRVPHEAVAGYLAEADIAIDPARCNDLNNRSTMIKIGEYLAAGLPTVSYGLRETMVTGRNAVLYATCGDCESFATHVAGLAKSESRREVLGRRGLRRIRGLTWERYAAELVGVYARLGGAPATVPARGPLPSAQPAAARQAPADAPREIAA